MKNEQKNGWIEMPGLGRGHYKDGKLHSVNDEPALVMIDGRLAWFDEDRLHRDKGPATCTKDGKGIQSWYQHDKRHREDGPAEILMDGSEVWYLNDKRLNSSQIEKLKLAQELNRSLSSRQVKARTTGRKI